MTSRRNHVLVVGAGPVGLATAVRCARAGLSTRVLDRAVPPIDKACGEGLMPRGVESLRALGIDPLAIGGRPFRGIAYVDGTWRAEARFRDGVGMGLRRTRLQEALVEAARRAGVALEFGRPVRGLAEGGVITDQGVVEGEIVVGADGLASRLRRWAGLEGGVVGRRFGVRRHYAVRPWSDLVEVRWRDHCEAYVTPVADREVGIAFLWDDRRRSGQGGFDAHLARFPRLRERLAGAEIASKDRGAGPMERRVRGVVRGRVALVGDAAGYVDAITGEGLTTGLQAAEALASAIQAGAVERYPAEQRRIQRGPRRLIRLLLALEKRPALRRRVMRCFAGDPSILERFLEMHDKNMELGAASPGLGALLRMGRSILTG